MTFADIEQTATRNGFTLTATIEPDYDHGAPWDAEDGHGPVSDWTTRDKAPGELVLSESRGRKRFYNYAEACRIARRDGWGISAELHERLFGARRVAVRSVYHVQNGIRQDRIVEWRDVPAVTPTARQIAAAAAMADYEWLRGWCNDQWYYVGVVVTASRNGIELGNASLWGIESDAGDYLLETANDLAREAISDARAAIDTLTQRA